MPDRGSRVRAAWATTLTCACLFCAGPAHSLAAPPAAPWQVRAVGGGLTFALDASVARLGGTATEFAYDHLFEKRFKLSELTWDFRDAVVAGARASVGFGGRFRLALGAWRLLDGGDGTMVDRDWMYSEAIILGLVDPSAIGDEDWTHESRHPDTTLDDATLLDLNLSALGWRRGPLCIGGVVGYRRDRLRWSARGGTWVYSVNGFRDRAGEFKDRAGNDLAVIDYEQQYDLIYLGLTLGWEGEALRVEGRLLTGGALRASDTDHHLLRATTFEGEFADGWFRGAGVEVTWRFLPRWYGTLAAAYQQIDGLSGDVVMTAPEGRWLFEEGAGIGLEMTTLAAGVGFLF